MKKILYLLLVVSQFCAAQAYQYQWAKKAGSTGGDNYGNGICTDKANNVYVTGYMDSTYRYCRVDTNTPVHYSYSFVSKYSPAGALKWKQQINGVSINQGLHVATDTSANVYVVGRYNEYDTNTNQHCQTTPAPFDGLLFNTAIHIHDTIYINDSVLISGNNYYHFHDTVVVDSTFFVGNDTIHGNNLFRVYIAKYDSMGSFLWVNKIIGLNANINASGVTTDDFGNLYVSGQFFGTAKFDKDTIYSSGNGDYYLAKYSADSGKLAWVQHGAASCSGVAYSHTTGKIYITGTYLNTATFGATTLLNQGNFNNNDIYVAAIDTGGTWIWAKAAGGQWDDESKGISIDGTGNIFITGYLTVGSWAKFGADTVFANSSDLYVAKYSALGNVLWAVSAGGSDVDDVNAIACDNTGNVYLAGDFQNTATFGTNHLNAKGGYDIFIAKYNGATGAVIGSQLAGGASNDVPNSMAIDGANGVYITGSFKDTCWFGNNNANRLLAGTATDIFVAKVGINVGINEAIGTTNSALNIYPNPTTGAVTINYVTAENTSLTIKLTNLEGQVIYAEQKKQSAGMYKHTLDFSQQAKGIYFVEIITDKETLVRKLIVQ